MFFPPRHGFRAQSRNGHPSPDGNDLELCTPSGAEGYIYTPAIRLGFARRTFDEQSRSAHPVTLRIPPVSTKRIE